MKRNQEGIIPVIIAILVIFLIAGAYFVGTKNGNLNSVVTVGTPVATQSSDSNVSWVDYKDVAYGFSFMYDPAETVNRYEYNSNYGGKEVVLNTNYNNYNVLDVFIEENTNKVSLDRFVKDNTSLAKLVIDKKIGSLDGKVGEFDNITTGGGNGVPGGVELAHLEYYFQDGVGRLYRVRLAFNNNGNTPVSDSDTKLFNQIILTFKLTN